MAPRIAQPLRKLDLTLGWRLLLALLFVVATAGAILHANLVARASGVAAEERSTFALAGAGGRGRHGGLIETAISLEAALELAVLTRGITAIAWT